MLKDHIQVMLSRGLESHAPELFPIGTRADLISTSLCYSVAYSSSLSFSLLHSSFNLIKSMTTNMATADLRSLQAI